MRDNRDALQENKASTEICSDKNLKNTYLFKETREKDVKFIQN